MDSGRPCHFSSIHVCCSLPLQCAYHVRKCTLIKNVGPDLFQLTGPLPLSEVTSLCPGSPVATRRNLHKSGATSMPLWLNPK